MIELDDVFFKDIKIPYLSIPEGILAVFGPNGSGKSTLLKLIAGLILPETGKIIISGLPPRKTECGYISEFPDKNILFERAADEISSPLKFRHSDPKKTEKITLDIVEKLGISGIYEKNIMKLSGGEKVLVALATAISADPLLLIIDEADSHLDSKTADEIFEIIMQLEIPYVIFCTQNMERVCRSADYSVYMEDGMIKASGPSSSVFSRLKGTCFYPETG